MDYQRHQNRHLIHEMLRRPRRASHMRRRIYGGSHTVYNQYTQQRSLDGLNAGSDTPAIEQGIQTAANFIPIPGAGQVVGAIMQIMNSVFGWGDSTPLDTLYDTVVELRLQLAEANRVRGIDDTFHIPTGIDTSNQGELETLGLAVVNDILHKVPSVHLSDDTSYQIQHDQLGPKLWPAYVHEARADLYKAIAALKSELGTAQIGATNTQLTTPPPPPPGYTDSSQSGEQPGQTSTTSASMFPSINWQADMPYILAGAGFLLLLTIAGKGSSNE